MRNPVIFKLFNGNLYHTFLSRWITVCDTKGIPKAIVFSREEVGLPTDFPEFLTVKMSVAEFNEVLTARYDPATCRCAIPQPMILTLIPYIENPFKDSGTDRD